MLDQTISTLQSQVRMQDSQPMKEIIALLKKIDKSVQTLSNFTAAITNEIHMDITNTLMKLDPPSPVLVLPPPPEEIPYQTSLLPAESRLKKPHIRNQTEIKQPIQYSLSSNSLQCLNQKVLQKEKQHILQSERYEWEAFSKKYFDQNEESTIYHAVGIFLLKVKCSSLPLADKRVRLTQATGAIDRRLSDAISSSEKYELMGLKSELMEQKKKWTTEMLQMFKGVKQSGRS